MIECSRHIASTTIQPNNFHYLSSAFEPDVTPEERPEHTVYKRSPIFFKKRGGGGRRGGYGGGYGGGRGGGHGGGYGYGR